MLCLVFFKNISKRLCIYLRCYPITVKVVHSIESNCYIDLTNGRLVDGCRALFAELPNQ